MSPKHIFLALAVLFLALTVVACGSTTATASGGSTPTATAMSSSAQALVRTVKATVGGKSATILTDAKGMTLYYNSHDTSTKVVCTGVCTQTWHPLFATSLSMVTSSTSLHGALRVATTANGMQVEYNGHPLYTYSKDTAPGQTIGEGIQGTWFVVTKNLPSQNG